MDVLKERFLVRMSVAVLMVFFLILGMAGMAAAEDFALGDIPLDKETYEKYIKKLPPDRLDAAHPSSYDARNAGIVTPAKNQGSCGSCWAFASAGALESHLLKKYSAGPYDLSEQQLLRCNTYGYSCSGGSSNAPRYWESTGPITESCYPYTATDGSCSYSCTEMVYRVTGWHTVTASEWYFKDSCYNEGPSYWRYQVYSDFSDGVGGGWWNTAASGAIYVHTSGIDRGGHAVLLIGWDDTKGAYLCKNSWGATGGPNGDGTFWIAYSGHADNLENTFGMSNFNITGGGSVGTLQYSWNMNTNPGWTTQGLWAWGPPTGGGGDHGGPDPSSGYTGSNVYGYNLSGDYENNLPERHLTSTAVNCAGLSNVSLKFRRWLGVEQPSYDHAYVRVSNNGTTWTTVWQNNAVVTDASWVLQDFDISSVADGQSTVYLRWTMGTTDVGWQYCGWNIDDVEIWGVGVVSPCPTCSGGAVVLNGDTFPSGECPCTGTTISLINVTVPNNATAIFTASTSITVGSGTTFENGSNATLTSPNNTFLPGSHIENGAVLNVGQ